MIRLLVLLCLTCPLWAQGTWTECNLDSLKVRFPQPPHYRMGGEYTKAGPVFSETYEYQGGAFKLLASRTKLPDMALDFRSPEALYDQAREEFLKENQATQTAYHPLKVVGKPGAELEFALPKSQESGRTRFVIVDGIFLTTQATWKDQAAPPEVARFFDSAVLEGTADR